MSSDPKPAFDTYADGYDRALAQGLSVSGEGKDYFARGRVEWLARELQRRAFQPRRLLDFGCGTGTSVPLLLELPGAESVLGVDISERSLAVARANHPDARAQFSLVTGKPPDGTVDLAFCNGAFHHIPVEERAGAIAYVRAALRPGGLFAFWENNPWNPGTRYVMSRIPFDRDAVLVWPRGARRLLTAGGFQILTTRFHFIFPKALAALRFLEPPLSAWPIGAQYVVLSRAPESRPA